MTAAEQPSPRKPFYKRVGFWVTTAIISGLIAFAAVAASQLAPRALAAQDALQAAVPLATQAKNQILAGETEPAKATVAELTSLSKEAEEATDSFWWRVAEAIPIAGENFTAVRLVASSVTTISTDVLTPATDVNLTALRTDTGAFDIASISALLPIVEQASTAATESLNTLEQLNQNQLVGPVKDGVTKLEESLTELNSMVGPATDVLTILPAMLGADGPKNYLFMFPNNAEIRAVGGNPASISIITADNGNISITEQASSADFRRNNLPINPETEALYDTRTRQMMQDATYTPYFAETAELMRGHWADAFGTPIDGVVSFDPVALSYLLAVTGPVILPTGEELNSENAVPLLLNEVYFRYPVNQQDAFFAAAAESVFSALTSGSGDTKKLLEALVRAADEGRLMYSSNDENEMKLISKTRIAGPLPDSNEDATVLGVFYNYVLAAKMDYYLDSTVTAETTQCTVSGTEPATFTATTTLTNILTPEQVPGLPGYVIAANGGGDIYRDVMFYGPVGTEVASVTVNGTMVQPYSRWENNYRVMPHNGRPVVQVPMLVAMQETASITVTFTAAANQPADSFGPFEVRATPTVRTTPVEVSRPGCD